MANRKVTLVANVKTREGWRRYPVAWGKNGRIKPDAVMISGKEWKFTEGVYQLRRYKGTRMVYESVGANAADAVIAQKKAERLLAAREHATAAGAKIVEPEGRKYLRRALEMYMLDRENKGALEAREHADRVGHEFLTVSGKTFVDEVTKDDVYRFHRALRKDGKAPRTVANAHARLWSILRFAGVPKDVMPDAPKVEKELPTTYTVEDIKAIRAAADEHMTLVIDLGLKCGLREQEMMHLEWGDIHWTDKVLRVQGKPEWGFAVKDSEQREMPIPDDLLAALKTFRHKHPKTRLILGNGDGKPQRHLLRNLKQLARRAKLNCKVCDGCKGKLNQCQEWTLHKFRRTYATTLLRNGIDLRTVQRFMGHSDLGSTMRYLRPASNRETQAIVSAIKWELD